MISVALAEMQGTCDDRLPSCQDPVRQTHVGFALRSVERGLGATLGGAAESMQRRPGHTFRPSALRILGNH
jgi:hypothetical protein